MTKLQVQLADIATLVVDAIVNSANPSLLAGSGLSGWIHKKAGKRLEQACLQVGGCEKGRAVLTHGYDLPARFVIHAVGPHYLLDSPNHELLLRSCYHGIFRLVMHHGLRSVAIPPISTGIYQYPKQEAAAIALDVIQEYLNKPSTIERIIISCIDDEMANIYQKEAEVRSIKLC